VDLADPVHVLECEAQRVGGDVAPIQGGVFRVDVKGDRVWVREREGALSPTGADEWDACPQCLAFQRHFTPAMTDVAHRNPMRCANGTVSGEPSGRVKIAVEGMNGWGVVAIEQWHIAHYLGEDFDGKESDGMWGSQ